MPRDRIDHIREFYERGGYIKPREDRKAAALRRVHYDVGGPVPAISTKGVLPLMRWTEKMWQSLPEMQQKALNLVGQRALGENKEGFVYGREAGDAEKGFSSRMVLGDENSVKLPPAYRKWVASPGSKPGTGQAWNVHSHPGWNSTAMPSGIPGDVATWLAPNASRFMRYGEGEAKPWQEMLITSPRSDQLLKIDSPESLWTGPGARLSGPRDRLDRGFYSEINPMNYLRNDDFYGGGIEGQTEAIKEWAKAHGVDLPRSVKIADVDPRTGGRLEHPDAPITKPFWPTYQSLAGGRWMDRMNRFGVGTEMDAATTLPGDKSVLLRDALESYVPFAKDRFGFKTGGSTVRKAAQLFKDYADPAASKIADWAWRPLQDVAKLFPEGLPKEVPEHVLEYGDFMQRMRAKGLDPRDALKAYTTTLSSIQRQARDRDLFPDMKFSSDERMIRPEGAFSDWLGTKAGQRYLERGSIGEADPEAIADMGKRLNSFGLMPTLSARMAEAPELIAKLAPSGWSGMMHELPGIDAAKKGFMGSMLGHGDRPTFDARQIALHTLPDPNPRIVQNMTRRGGGQGGEEAVARLAARQNAYDMFLPPEYRPDYQHLVHHTVWDAANQTRTPHADIMDMMENRAAGGRVGYDIGGPIRQGAKAIKYTGNLFEKWAQDTGRSVEDLVESLRSKNKDVKKYGDTQTMRGVSDRMDPSLYAGTKVDMESPVPPVRSIVNPQDLQGGYIVGGMSDLSSAGPTIRAINDIGMRKPIWMPGGSDFPIYNPDLWAGDPGALRGLTNALTEAGWKPGKNEGYFANQLMLPQAVDQTHMSMEAATSMLQGSGLSKKDAEAFNDAVRRYKISVNPTKADPRRTVEAMPDFPGIFSGNIDEYLANTPMARRSALLKVMDKKAMHDIGVPQAAAIRAAQTDPALVGAPQGTTGRTIGRLFSDPIIGDPTVPHESYTANLGGEFMGGFGKKVPGQLLFKDWIKEKGFDPKNMSSNDMRSMIVSPAVQKIDQRFLDWFMPKYEKLPDWKRGGRVGYADGGDVTPAIGVEGIKGLMNIIRKASGLKQARRFEDAADVANLKPYSEFALLNTFSRPTSVYGAMKPSEFERYAYPLDPNYAQMKPKAPGERAWYAAEGSKPDLGIGSYDEYLKHLQGIAEGSGFSSVPELSIGYRGRGETPIVTTHDGRHRLRALRGLDDSPSLVEFKPDSTSYRGVTVPSLPRVMQNGWVIPQNNVSKFDTVPLPDELFAFGGRV